MFCLVEDKRSRWFFSGTRERVLYVGRLERTNRVFVLTERDDRRSFVFLSEENERTCLVAWTNDGTRR